MNTNKKLLAVLSVPAVASLLAVAVTTPVKAATRDFYDISTSPATVYANADYTTNADKLNALITAATDHPSQFVYQYGANYYNYKTLFDSYSAAKAATPTTTVAAAFTTAIGNTATVPNPIVDTTKLAVSSVSATNYKEIVVTFNKAVDKTTAENINNYVLTGDTHATSLSGASAALQADGKTVVITLSGTSSTTVLTSQASDVLKVSGVKDAAGNVITAVSANFTPLDTTLPTVTGNVQVVGPTTLRVTFSEPIMTLPTITVDNNTYSASVTATAGDTHSVDVNLGAPLPAGNHTLTVSSAVDYANFSNISANLAFSYAQDTSALTASVVSAAQNQVVFKFNKAVPAAAQGYVSVYHTYNNVSQYQATSLAWGADNQTVTATFAGNYLPIGNDTVFVNAGTSPNVVKDAWGNAFAAASYNVAITADTTAPTVTSVSYVDANHIDVAYSKTVTGATTVTNYTLKDASGNAVSVLSAIPDATNPQLFHLTTASLAGGSYSLSIAGIKDLSLAQNALAPYATTVTVPDTTAPAVANNGVSYTTDKTKLIVSFNKQVATTGAYSALDATKYEVIDPTFGDKLVSQISGATVTLGADGKSVVISLPSPLTGATTVNIGQVADLSGNISAIIGTKTAVLNDVTVGNIDLTSVKAVSKTTITFDVNTTLSKIDVSKFKLKTPTGTTVAAATSATYVNGVGKSTVTVTFGSNVVNSDVSNLATLASPVTDLTDLTVDALGLTNSLGTSNGSAVIIPGTSVKDLIAPSVATAQTVDINNNGELDAITLTFDEALYAPSVSDSDFTVDGHTISSISVGGSTVTLNLKEAGLDATTTPKVTIVGAVQDAARNSIVVGSTVTPTVGVSTQSTKTAAIASVISGATVSSTGTNAYDINIPTASKSLTVQTLANDLSASQVAKLVGTVTVNGIDIAIPSTGITTAIENDIASALKTGALNATGVTAATTALSDAQPNSTIKVNGVTYTIR